MWDESNIIFFIGLIRKEFMLIYVKYDKRNINNNYKYLVGWCFLIVCLLYFKILVYFNNCKKEN